MYVQLYHVIANAGRKMRIKSSKIWRMVAINITAMPYPHNKYNLDFPPERINYTIISDTYSAKVFPFSLE